MNFLILRVLTHSELGMFHEYRRQGKEGSKQRAINFDGPVVDRVFPVALDTDRIPLDLRFDTDRGVQPLRHFLTRQAKNWRLEGNCPRDTCYAFVEPGCLFAMEVDAGRDPAQGAWVVFPPTHQVTQAVLMDGATAGLVRAGMIALHDEEGQRLQAMLHNARPDMFTASAEESPPMSETPAAVDGVKRLPPNPRRLAEIIANTGHTLASAVADIVDNSISADATEIDIVFSAPNGGHGRWMAIRDNGHGMNPQELDQAMTLGSLVNYENNSLGKFGYGLKGASWSQSAVFTVATRRQGGPICHLTWDRDNLGDWEANNAALADWEDEATRPGEHGTVVLWKAMKPPAAINAVGVAPWTAETTELNQHLGLVFHRFLEGDAKNRKKVTIRINGIPVVANNPVGHPLTEAYDQKPIVFSTQSGRETVTVQPFVLPSEEQIRQHHRAEGPAVIHDVLQRVGLYGRRNESQGLFIYRNDRLIKWGGWHQIWTTTDEKTKLARVIVSFGTGLDDQFDINITKRSVSLPSALQDEIKKLAAPVRTASKAKYSKTGAPVSAAPPSPTPAGPRLPPAPGVPTPSGPVPTDGSPVQPGNPPAAPAPSDEEHINLRVVTTSRFAWKIGPNLTGGRDLQISDRLAPLHALARRLGHNQDGIRELAAFLDLLGAKDIQATLLDPQKEP